MGRRVVSKRQIAVPKKAREAAKHDRFERYAAKRKSSGIQRADGAAARVT